MRRPQSSLPLRGLAAVVLIAAIAGCSGLATATDDDSPGSSQSGNQSSQPPLIVDVMSLPPGRWYGPNGLAVAALIAPSAYNKQVRFVLERTPGPWSMTATGVGSIPPDVVGIASPCVRDQYIAEAMIEAFGVEVNARVAFRDSRAQADVATYGRALGQSLRNAVALCSNASSVGGQTCSTLRYVSCPELLALLS